GGGGGGGRGRGRRGGVGGGSVPGGRCGARPARTRGAGRGPRAGNQDGLARASIGSSPRAWFDRIPARGAARRGSRRRRRAHAPATVGRDAPVRLARYGNAPRKVPHASRRRMTHESCSATSTMVPDATRAGLRGAGTCVAKLA